MITTRCTRCCSGGWPRCRASRRSYGDVAGIEGTSALVVSVTMFIVLGLFGVPLLVVGGSLARSIFVWARWRFSLEGTQG